ncbi:MAG: GNAT family N-acetyltransferase [Planctomycetota bacterium]|jgi:GNAT superfamily N-acetyltransferase|nr:MAG: GNAT family N-acetyltransferase [Planctomycetota bacterium]
MQPHKEKFVADIAIQPVETRSQQQRFIRLPWRIYADDPCWIPPVIMSQQELLGFRKHPFYERSKSQSFLATRGGRDVGRITAIVNAGHIDRYKEQRGFFGFFECDEDTAASRALFQAAGDWLHAQGMTCIRGPANPSLNYECGLLIEGFDTPPFFMMTHNRPWYAQLVEDAGFGKIEDMFAFWGETSMLGGLDPKLVTMVEGVKERFGVTIRPLDRRRFADEVRTFLHIYNESLGGTWGFVPLTSGEIDHMAASLKYLIEPELTLVAEVEGKPVGAVFCLLDYNPRIKAIDGRLFPFGFLRLLWNKKAIKRLRAISTNVIPEYQAWGIGLVLMNGLYERFMKWGLREVEFSWVLESNYLSRRTLERGGALVTKKYRIYQDDPPRP